TQSGFRQHLVQFGRIIFGGQIAPHAFLGLATLAIGLLIRTCPCIERIGSDKGKHIVRIVVAALLLRFGTLGRMRLGPTLLPRLLLLPAIACGTLRRTLVILRTRTRRFTARIALRRIIARLTGAQGACTTHVAWTAQTALCLLGRAFPVARRRRRIACTRTICRRHGVYRRMGRIIILWVIHHSLLCWAARRCPRSYRLTAGRRFPPRHHLLPATHRLLVAHPAMTFPAHRKARRRPRTRPPASLWLRSPAPTNRLAPRQY